MNIAREGIPTITLVVYYSRGPKFELVLFIFNIHYNSGIVLLPVWFLSIYFFRDPERVPPSNLSDEVLPYRLLMGKLW